MTLSILRITDGTTSVNLLEPNVGLLLSDWKPVIPTPKGDGTWQSSPFSDGRRLAVRSLDNAIETFELKMSSQDQDAAIAELRRLTDLLTEGVQYWTSDWQRTPVYIEARGAQESNVRYAVVYDWRIEGLNNPFSQPFYSCPSTMDSLTLMIERGHWLSFPPGTGECLSLSSEMDTNGAETSVNYTVAASADDATAVYGNPITDITTTELGIGTVTIGAEPFPQNRASGIRFSAVLVPAGATIISAYLTLVASTTVASPTLYAIIRTDDPDGADYGNNFGVGDVLTDRIYPLVSKIWTISAWTAGTSYNSASIVNLVQDYVDRASWSSGDPMVFLLSKSGGSTAGVKFAAEDHLTYGAAQLTIVYSTTERTVGQEETCNGVYVANKNILSQISHAYYYDDGTASYSANLIGSALPYALLPAVPAVDDILYIGVSTALQAGDLFSHLIFDIIPGDTGIVTDLEYCTNSVGPVFSSYGASTTLISSGITAEEFTQPSDWVTCTINGVTGYWVRYIVTTGGASAPQQQNRDIYTPVNAYAEIAADATYGDIAAIIKATTDTEYLFASCPYLFVGSRSMSRGENFCAYLNVDGDQNYQITSATPSTADMLSPYGNAYQVAIVGATSEVERFSWYISSSIGADFIGVYHAFLRIRLTAGTPSDIRFKLVVDVSSNMDTYMTDWYPASIATNTYEAVDMGLLIIGNSRARISGVGTQIQIAVRTETDDSVTVNFSDLILIPADEFYASSSPITPTASPLHVIDAITMFGERMAYTQTGNAIARQILSTSSTPFVQVGSHQRLWFLTADTGYTALGTSAQKVSVEKQERYLAYRGDI